MVTKRRVRNLLPLMLLFLALLVLPTSRVDAQVLQLRGAGTIREKPPGELATIQRRDPDFSTVRYLALQRDFRPDLTGTLLIGHAVVQINRPIAPMLPIIWPPEIDR